MPVIRVQVTDRDISKGKPGDEFNCPVALALQRATGRVMLVEPLEPPDDETLIGVAGVNPADPLAARVIWVDETLRRTGKIPTEVGHKILQYDATHEMLPFHFEIEVPGAGIPR